MFKSSKHVTETMNQSTRFLCRTLSAVTAWIRGKPPGFCEAGAPGKAFGRFIVEALCLAGRSALFVELANDNRPMRVADGQVKRIARTDFARWFDVLSIYSGMAGDDGRACQSTRLVEPRGPKPFVNALGWHCGADRQ